VGSMKKLSMVIAFSFLLVLTVIGNAVPAGAQEKQAPSPPSLYDRLGGVYSIATVVDDFIERLLINKTLNANRKINEARQRVPKAGLKFQVTALVCQVTGGPCQYRGRSMKDAHSHLDITGTEWQAMVVDFKTSLDKFKVPSKEQGELIAIVESTKGDIVLSAK
jgi:hemoglobin